MFDKRPCAPERPGHGMEMLRTGPVERLRSAPQSRYKATRFCELDFEFCLEIVDSPFESLSLLAKGYDFGAKRNICREELRDL